MAHADPFSPVLLELGVIIIASAAGRGLANRLRQPAVLGELVFGMIIGNIGYFLGKPLFFMIMHLDSVTKLSAEIWTTGYSVKDAAIRIFTSAELEPGGIGAHMTSILTGPGGSQLMSLCFAFWLFSNLGIILLLFMVGLETSVKEMAKVGLRSFYVAVVGVIAPFILGFGVASFLLPHVTFAAHLFIGATLTATSVGITARVFKDLNCLNSPEAKIILGAAVIDDILGLIVLAVVVGIVTTGHFEWDEVTRISLSSLMFLGAMTVFGSYFVRLTVPFARVLDDKNLKLLYPLTFAFLSAWLASLMGLATIVGAFAAGLVLQEEHFPDNKEARRSVQDLLGPFETIFAPIFFVLMGMQVNLEAFLLPGTGLLAILFVIAAVIGKVAAGTAAGKGRDRMTIGIGMIPRGEVGLIFASIGKSVGVVSGSVFAAIVIMVMVTTLITPIGLKWSLSRAR